MALLILSVADGQLANSKGTLYTVPASTTTIISNIVLVNTNTTAEVVNLYLCPSGGTSRRIISKNLSLGIGYTLVMDDKITMSTGDKLEGDTTTGSKVDFTINGVERT